jgi:transcriptional regulator with XRE-family HTH domain
MGVATTLVWSWENGKGQPDNRQLDFLAKILEFSLSITRKFHYSAKKLNFFERLLLFVTYSM